MMRLSATIGSTLAFFLAVAVPGAWAEDIGWTYSWSGTTSVANAGGGGVKFNLGAGEFSNGQNGVTAATLEAFGAAGLIGGKYSLTMHLVDKTSKEFTDLTFTGV